MIFRRAELALTQPTRAMLFACCFSIASIRRSERILVMVLWYPWDISMRSSSLSFHVFFSLSSISRRAEDFSPEKEKFNEFSGNTRGKLGIFV